MVPFITFFVINMFLCFACMSFILIISSLCLVKRLTDRLVLQRKLQNGIHPKPAILQFLISITELLSFKQHEINLNICHLIIYMCNYFFLYSVSLLGNFEIPADEIAAFLLMVEDKRVTDY